MDDFGLMEGYGDVVEECSQGEGVWLKIPARGSLSVVLLRERPVRYWAHWQGFQPKWCPGPDRCKLCKDHIARKIHYVYSVFDLKQSRTGLVDIPPQAAAQILRSTQDLGRARGVGFTLRKEGGKVNGRIEAVCVYSGMCDDSLPDGPDPAAVLRKQWSLPSAESIPL